MEFKKYLVVNKNYVKNETGRIYSDDMDQLPLATVATCQWAAVVSSTLKAVFGALCCILFLSA